MIDESHQVSIRDFYGEKWDEIRGLLNEDQFSAESKLSEKIEDLVLELPELKVSSQEKKR